MKYLVLALAVLVTTKVSAQGLMINAAEVGVGKFHRYDAKQHPKEYANHNVWSDYVMPDAPVGNTPFVYETAPNKITIQFQTLEELLTAIVKVSAQKGQKVAVLNLNGHGMPGGMWFPKDEAEKASGACASWNKSALAPDIDNYNQYYSPVSLSEIISIRMAARVIASYGCTTGASAWKEVAARVKGLKDAFAENAQVHFESCTVGLGKAGEDFASTVASLLLTGDKASVQTLIPLGLGDWSMPEGMGFWDFQSISQLNADNKRYPVNKNDREEMQKGTVRVTKFVNGTWTSQLISNLDFMMVGFEAPPAATINTNGPTVFDVSDFGRSAVAPQSVRIPGTAASVDLIQ